jgi:undecaprenyl-diphosphatase
MEDQGQVIDVAVHVGTLGAVILYFWRDVKLGLSGMPRMLTGRIDTPDRNSPSCWPSPRSRSSSRA